MRTLVPEHLHTVTPRLALSDAAAGIDFYKAAFDVKELGERCELTDGTLVHAQVLIGDSGVVKDAQGDEFTAPRARTGLTSTPRGIEPCAPVPKSCIP